MDYRGIAKHKRNPATFDLPPYTGAPRGTPGIDFTFCDYHADFTRDDLPLVLTWMRRGIHAALFGASDSLGDPSMLWAISHEGWVFESQLTHPGNAVYHGYPLLPNDEMAPDVVARFRQLGGHVDEWRQALESAQARYV